MNLNDILKQKDITKYRLSKISGVPFTTISEITTGKIKIKNCTGTTLYRLAKSLDIMIEDLLMDSVELHSTEYRLDFDIFKSNVCHQVKDMGDIDFIITLLESDEIRKQWEKEWYPESLYLLAMLDYLSRENDLPLCDKYSDLRIAKLHKPIYPSSILMMSIASNSAEPKKESYNNAIPEFRQFNIIENEVRNVV